MLRSSAMWCHFVWQTPNSLEDPAVTSVDYLKDETNTIKTASFMIRMEKSLMSLKAVFSFLEILPFLQPFTIVLLYCRIALRHNATGSNMSCLDAFAKFCENRLVASSLVPAYQSVRQRGTTHIPLPGIPWNLKSIIFRKYVEKKSSFFNTRHE
jgi:hypothetical protein